MVDMKYYMWISFIVGFVIAFLPLLIAFRYKNYTRDELVTISPDYENINRSFMMHFVGGMLLLLPMTFLLINLNDILDSKYGPILAPVWGATFFSVMGIMYGLLAARRGIYPVSKYLGSATAYAYREDDKIIRMGRLQVIVSICFIVISILIALARIYFVE